MAKKVFLKQSFLDLEEELSDDLLKRQRPLIRWAMHVIKQAIVPQMAYITYEKLPVTEGRILQPDNCFHIFGVYTVDKEDMVLSLISEAQGLIKAYPQEDQYSGLVWQSLDNSLNTENGIPFVENRDYIATMSIDDELIVMYASIEKNDNNEVIIDEGLIDPIVAYIKYKVAERNIGRRINKGRRSYPGDMAYTELLKQEYARILSFYTGSQWAMVDTNEKRNKEWGSK